MSGHELPDPGPEGELRDTAEISPEELSQATLENVRQFLGYELPAYDEVVDELPESERDELEEVFFGVDLEERLSRMDDFLRERDDVKYDFGHVIYLGKIWGIGGNGESNLAELFEDRRFDAGSVEELFIYTSYLKDSLLGPDTPLDVDDLEQMADNNLPGAIHQGLQSVTGKGLMRLGFSEDEVRMSLELADEKYLRALHWLGWLTYQPFMREFNERARTLVTKRLPPITRLIDLALRSIDSEIYMYLDERKKSRGWKIDFQREASLRRQHRLASTKNMSELIFLGVYKNIDA